MKSTSLLSTTGLTHFLGSLAKNGYCEMDVKYTPRIDSMTFVMLSMSIYFLATLSQICLEQFDVGTVKTDHSVHGLGGNV